MKTDKGHLRLNTVLAVKHMVDDVANGSNSKQDCTFVLHLEKT